MQTSLIRRTTMDRLGLLCRNIYENNKMTQRELAAAMDISLGTCNHLVKKVWTRSFFFWSGGRILFLIKGGVDLLRNYRMDSAVILAAGFGSDLYRWPSRRRRDFLRSTASVWSSGRSSSCMKRASRISPSLWDIWRRSSVSDRQVRREASLQSGISQ